MRQKSRHKILLYILTSQTGTQISMNRERRQPMTTSEVLDTFKSLFKDELTKILVWLTSTHLANPGERRNQLGDNKEEEPSQLGK